MVTLKQKPSHPNLTKGEKAIKSVACIRKETNWPFFFLNKKLLFTHFADIETAVSELC